LLPVFNFSFSLTRKTFDGTFLRKRAFFSCGPAADAQLPGASPEGGPKLKHLKHLKHVKQMEH
jgi:hypothetical protein